MPAQAEWRRLLARASLDARLPRAWRSRAPTNPVRGEAWSSASPATRRSSRVAARELDTAEARSTPAASRTCSWRAIRAPGRAQSRCEPGTSSLGRGREHGEIAGIPRDEREHLVRAMGQRSGTPVDERHERRLVTRRAQARPSARSASVTGRSRGRPTRDTSVSMRSASSASSRWAMRVERRTNAGSVAASGGSGSRGSLSYSSTARRMAASSSDSSSRPRSRASRRPRTRTRGRAKARCGSARR